MTLDFEIYQALKIEYLSLKLPNIFALFQTSIQSRTYITRDHIDKTLHTVIADNSGTKSVLEQETKTFNTMLSSYVSLSTCENVSTYEDKCMYDEKSYSLKLIDLVTIKEIIKTFTDIEYEYVGTCDGCAYNSPGQSEHMGLGGCLDSSPTQSPPSTVDSLSDF